MRLCDACRVESAAWLDYRPAQSYRFANNASFDDTTSGMREISRARFVDWRETVRFQQGLIRERCARDHQLLQLRIGSLFTGYGGLDQAARAVFGGELAWVSDNHPSAVKLLAHRYPNVPNLGDITAIDWSQVEPVDLVTAGFPCTDISTAGKRAGIKGKHSGLWSHAVDAVRVLRPRHVVLENVSALLVRGLDRVVADLAALGYDLRWSCLRASDVGAPHRRDRWFGYATPASNPGCDAWQEDHPDFAATAWSGGSAASDSDRSGVRKQPVRESRRGSAAVAVQLGAHNASSDAHSVREQQRSRDVADLTGRTNDRAAEVEWGQFEPAIRRWEHLLGRRVSEPTIPGRNGPVLNPRFVEWLMGLPLGHVTDVPDLSRTEMLRLLGNGVVVQQGTAALRWLVGRQVNQEAA